MKKTVYAVSLTALFTANLQANSVGLYIGGQIWQSNASGVFGEENDLLDFDLKKQQRVDYFFVASEHPYPLLPNLRFSYTELDFMDKSTSLSRTSASDEDYYSDHNNTYKTSFNASYIDYTLYYQLLDTDLLSFDLGLSARDFDGAVTYTDTTTTISYFNGTLDRVEAPNTITDTDKIKADDIVPMLYVATNISFPSKRLSVFAQGDLLLDGDNSLYDYQVGWSYELVNNKVMDLKLTFGYRAVKMELEDLGRLYTNLDFKGAFVGVITHF